MSEIDDPSLAEDGLGLAAALRGGCASAWKLGPVNFGKPIHGAAANAVKEDQSADARKQQRQVKVKTHDQRRDNRAATHLDPVLQTRNDRLAPRQALLGQDHARRLQLPMRKISLSHFQTRGR